jgi:hypothetical protein
MTKEIQENSQKVIDVGIANDNQRPAIFDSLNYVYKESPRYFYRRLSC